MLTNGLATGNILTYTELRDTIRDTFTRLALKGHFLCRRPDVPYVLFQLHNSMLMITGNTLTYYKDVRDFITKQFYASLFKGRPGHCYGTLLRNFITGHF